MNKVKSFVKICKFDQKRLKAFLYRKLIEAGYTPKSGDGYLLGVGSNILVTAHMDTVHKENVKKVIIENVAEFNERNKNVVKQFLPQKGWVTADYSISVKGNLGNTVISSPQGIGGDDRCGIFMILELLDRGYRPTVLFCEDEEIGGVGSNKFIKTMDSEVLSDMKYLIELDRANEDDAVFYDCGNKDFQNYVMDMTGYVKATGSFSDIGHLSPDGDVASVNLSCGYYKAHTTSEYVVFEEMMNTIDKVTLLLDDEKNVDKFDYQEIVYTGFYNNYYHPRDYYSDYYIPKAKCDDDEWIITFVSEDGEIHMDIIEADYEAEAVYEFMTRNPDLCISYNTLEVVTYDEYVDFYSEDPYEVYERVEFGEEYDDDNIEYVNEFEKANSAILDDIEEEWYKEYLDSNKEAV